MEFCYKNKIPFEAPVLGEHKLMLKELFL